MLGTPATSAGFVKVGNPALGIFCNLLKSAGSNAPTLTNAVITDSDPFAVLLTFNQSLNESKIPDPNQFSIYGGNYAESVVVSGATVTITCLYPFDYSNAITVDYAQYGLGNDLAGLTGILVAGFNGYVVTNNLSNTWVTLTDGSVTYRKIVRDSYLCIDKTLTVTGFDGTEDVDWTNIKSINISP